MSTTALITGASKGIGLELAHLFAENGCNLFLVARSADELRTIQRQIQGKHGVQVMISVKDLSLAQSAAEVFNEVKTNGISVDFLVNNAGFGDYGAFADTRWERYQQMIALNVTTLTHLSHLFADEWIRTKKTGKILNISSTAAFQPGPMMAVYFATKAFVLSLSEAIGSELKPHGITVTALCPGPTATHFGAESKMNASDLVKNVKIADAKEVALSGYRAMMKGTPTVIHGTMNKLVVLGERFLPRKWVTRLAANVMRRS